MRHNSFNGSWGLHLRGDGHWPAGAGNPPSIASFAVRRTALHGRGWASAWVRGRHYPDGPTGGTCGAIEVNGTVGHGVVEHTEFSCAEAPARDMGNALPGVFVSPHDVKDVTVR